MNQTNVQVEQEDVRLVAVLKLWSDLIAAVRAEHRPKGEPSTIVNMAAWRNNAAAGSLAGLYRMTADRPPQSSAVSGAEAEFLDELTGDNPDTSISGPLRGEVRSTLVRAVDELPPKERTVIALYYFEQLTLKQIKHALKVTEPQVSTIHAHAIITMRARLSSLLDTFRPSEPQSGEVSSSSSADSSFWNVVERFHAISPTSESAAIRNGLSANVWYALELLGFSRRELASVVGTSEKTIHRKILMSEVLAIAEGDRTMRLVRLMLQTLESFRNTDKAFSWLRRPNRALHGQAPLDTMVTETGAALVRRALGVIAYGGVA